MNKEEKLDTFLAPDADMGKMEDILKTWVTGVNDEKLRVEMAEALAKERGITKSPIKTTYKLRLIRPLLVAAASIVLLIGFFYLYPSDVSPSHLATQYVETQTLQHPGSFKGVSIVNQSRTQGIIAFNNGDFKQAIIHFEEISAPNDEDTYYLGLAHLKVGQYKDAAVKLEQSANNTSRFHEEVNWFLALTYILDGRSADALSYLSKIKKGDWRFDEAQELMLTLNKIN